MIVPDFEESDKAQAGLTPALPWRRDMTSGLSRLGAVPRALLDRRPVNRPDFEFGAALIGKDLRPTQVYHDASKINREFLAPVGRELKHLVSESVVHAIENPLPLGAKPFAADAVVQSVTGGSVVIGRFRQAVDDGQRWLLVANRSYKAQTTARPEFAPATGDYRPVAASFDVRLRAGEARLDRLEVLR